MARRNWPFAKMIALIRFVFGLLASLRNAKGRLEAEDAVLRQQLIALRHKSQVCARLTNGNRRFLVQPYQWFPSIHDVLTIARPETVARWHRGGFRRHWHWKLRRGGRQQLQNKLRVPVRQGSSIALGEAHLLRIRRCHVHCYNEIRTHRLSDNDAPRRRDSANSARPVTANAGWSSSSLRAHVVFGADR